ncbi:hypothetical protein N0V82_002838 [Gnomoniopsis sp. IMI 355080]|nr:hypothetical protein N0V82_002838 [Gnomoniopsis sp. IMI 355080]
MATELDKQLAETHFDVNTGQQWNINYNGLSNELISADLVPESHHRHVFAATTMINGKGRCTAWLIKPELVDLDDYDQFELSPGDARELMREVFDWPRSGVDATNKGVKFLQQFDMDYDYLEEELYDIRDHAWIVLFRSVHVDENYQRQGVGTALVRTLVQQMSKLAQLEERPVLAFAKLEKSALQPEEIRSSPADSSLEESHDLERPKRNSRKAKIQALFWQSLAFERLNDGHLFAKDMDWLVWSPKARNAALLFERAAAFPIDFDALIEDHLADYE